ncbi:MAG: outer membrane beta-barrel protein, partial [Spirosomataceae bacterium]
MKKLLVFLLLSVYSFSSVQAQSNASYLIQGKIQDKKGETLPFATLLVISSSDSSLVKGDVTDIDGNFQIELKKGGSFRLQATMIGYESFFSPVFQLNSENARIQFPLIILQESSTTLSEVKIVAKKPFIEQKIDRTVLNVENSIVSSGSTALEILERAPGVTIDSQNDQIRLRNKSGVLFMIDGKRTFLSEADLAQMLRNMTSDQIESVEIITNPSSKYDAAGNSGIINIKLKKNQQVGTNGTFTLGAGNGFIPDAPKDLSRYNSSLQVNHRTKKLNMFANVSANRNLFYSDNTLNRRVTFENTLTTFDQKSQRVQEGKGISFKTGFDYTLNAKTSIGLLIDGSDWEGKLDGTNATDIKAIEQTSLAQTSQIDMTRLNFSSSLQVKHAFDTKGKELTFDTDYSRFVGDNTQNFETNFFNAQNIRTSQLFQRNFTPTFIDIFTAKTDYTLPINEKTKWEVGAKTAYVQTDNNFVFEQLIEENWANDPTKTNYFKYTEFVNAGYINYSKQWEKIGVQAGLRAEHTHSIGNSVTLDEKLERNYLSLFPTLFINHTLSKDHAAR